MVPIPHYGAISLTGLWIKRAKILGSVLLGLGAAALAYHYLVPKTLDDVKVTKTGYLPFGGTSDNDGYPDTSTLVPFVRVESLDDCLIGTGLNNLKTGDLLKEVRYRPKIAACDQLIDYKK